MVDRLSLIDTNLPERVQAVSDDVRRDIARAVAFAAVDYTNIDDPRITAAADGLRAGQVGDTPERIALGELVEELDNHAFDAQDRLDDGTGSEEEYDREFCRARAANALWSAFEDDPAAAASDAIYEAYHAVDDDTDVVTTVYEARL